MLSAMKTIVRLSLGFVLFLGVRATFISAAPVDEFFVSPAGRDTNPGTKSEAFATPQRAMTAVRALVARGLKRDVRVTFAGGAYELAAPLVFTPADSGTVEHSVTYAAAAAKTVVISGGRKITNWKHDKTKWTAFAILRTYRFPDFPTIKKF